MKIIVEAGGTKCKWGLINNDLQIIKTSGFNPNISPASVLLSLCHNVQPKITENIDTITYYGAGCYAETNKKMVADTLSSAFNCADIKVLTDLEGSAVALFGNRPGIAAILGTGAAAGYYNGQRIERQTPSLGYLIGDEGSGAYIGKVLIAKAIRGEFSRELCKNFFDFAGLSSAELIKNVYSEHPANSYLANFVSFACANITEPEIATLINDAFYSFHTKHIEPLKMKDLPIGFVGGVAWQFSSQLREFYARHNLEITILKDAFGQLCKYLSSPNLSE